MFNNNYSDYKDFERIRISFKNKPNINNVLLKIYYKSDNENNLIHFSYLNKDGFELLGKDYRTNGREFDIKKEELNASFNYNLIEYSYVDKLYKTYNIKEEVTEDYYYELEGYEKIESSKKTYYRYITSDYILVSSYGIIVDDYAHCRKYFCRVVYVVKEDEEPEEPVKEVEEPVEEKEVEEPKEEMINPTTLDNVYIYFSLLFFSIISIVFIYKKKIYLVLSNRFKKH